jgi:Zn ribbon nucleic-acid-binding protein
LTRRRGLGYFQFAIREGVMSQQTIYPISCPKCRAAQDVALYDSINVAASPELREQWLANQLNRVACPKCGFSFRVDKPLLYNDPVRRFMIYLLPAGPDPAGRQEQQFADLVRSLTESLPPGVQAPALHLVVSRSEMVERIFLLEAGLNERIIEYIKHIIYTRNVDRLDPAAKNLLFDAQDSTAETLCFVVQNLATQKLDGVLQYSRAAYQGLCEMFDRDEQTPSLMELFPGPRVNARALLLREAQTERRTG